ncbi:MAG: DUF86 domain-containing protein [Acidobacteriia bacterium]|nr:DUF86 domain-containing protein [Terriglobia bacterium]
MKDDRVYLKHILRCVARIEEYTRGGREMFLSTSIVQDATLRNLQTLAESTQRLSADLKSRYPNVDWRALSGFRNVLVHDYLGIDMDYVYQSIQDQIPGLKSAVQALLENLSNQR